MKEREKARAKKEEKERDRASYRFKDREMQRISAIERGENNKIKRERGRERYNG